MSLIIHLVPHAAWKSETNGPSVRCVEAPLRSLRYNAPLPGNASEDRSKVTSGSCLRLIRFASSRDRAELQSRVSNAPHFGKTWDEREVIAERTATIDFGRDFRGDTCRAMRENKRGCCCQSCHSSHGYLEAMIINHIPQLFSHANCPYSEPLHANSKQQRKRWSQ